MTLLNMRIPNSKSKILVLLWAAYALVGFAIHWRAYGYPFLLDDTFHFAGNPTVRSWRGVWTVWTTNYWESLGQGGLYRPLLKTFWIAEIAGLGGGRGTILAVSILLHALNAALVAALAMQGGAGAALAGAAGLWFVAHAANSEVLLEAVGQGEIFSLAFCLAAFLLVFPKKDDEERFRHPAGRWIGCTALLTAGLFVKEQAYGWVPVCALAVLMNAGIPRRQKAYASCAIVAGLAIAMAARLCVLRGVGPEGVYLLGADLSWPQRLTLVVHLFGRYVALALAPWKLSPDYTWLRLELPMAWGNPYTLAGAAAGALCVAGLARAIRRRQGRWLLLGLAALAPLGPVLGLRPIGTLFAEHLAYHALAGVGALVAIALNWAATGSPARAAFRKRALAGALALAAGGLGLTASVQVRAWESGEALWKTTLREHPRSYFAAANLAYYLMTQGRFPEARSSAEAALRIEPDFADAHLTLGELDLAERRPESARAHFERGVGHPALGFRARVGIAAADLQMGRIGEARKECDALATERPDDPSVRRLQSALASAGG